MARTIRNQAQKRHSRIRRQARKATVVHDGSAFQLATELRDYGFEVDEGPLFSSLRSGRETGELAVIATRHSATRSARLRECARELCWKGAPVLAVGAAVGPVAELFGAFPGTLADSPADGRLADIHSASEGLLAGVPSEFRLALPAGERVETKELSAEFSVTAWSRDGELVAASHVFRPVHLLHAAVLESKEVGPSVLHNLLAMLRERGGRAF